MILGSAHRNGIVCSWLASRSSISFIHFTTNGHHVSPILRTTPFEKPEIWYNTCGQHRSHWREPRQQGRQRCVFNNSRLEEIQYEQNNLGICQAQDRYSGSGQFSQMVFTGYHVSTNWQNFREGATIKCVLRQVCTATFNSFTSMPRKQFRKPCSEGPYIFPFSTKLKRKLPGHVCGSWDTKVAFKHPSFHRPGQ